MALDFDNHFEPAHGEAIEVAPGVRRITADNPSAFTFHGTNSYILGTDTLAVIDPGPVSENHFQALLRAIGGRPVSHIFVSHTHADHSPLARQLKEATGSKVYAEGPHRPARPLRIGEINPLDASADTEFMLDVSLADGELVEGDGWSLRAIYTPGHTANHLAFALEGTGILFSADHVMAWATTIVAPPDGAMSDYMASLDKLMERDYTLYLPGHGGPVRQPSAFLRGLKTHRRMRERAILERLRSGDRTIPEMVAAIYRDTDPRLHNAAGLSVLAHLEDMVARGLVEAEGEPSIGGIFIPR
ncbi:MULTISPECIES: MBL fold metallo-hydrolase [unclassified Aminobacter]|uniref:MBL fold metallo-hydrolase n=1 Tax=unclassified Aminobacter TaxID=2644704 RepID=UPI0004660279|nr:MULTISPECIES: MBL fold metallo-hydrolase [unclassified Aminobacter]TWG63021.1 glyoxylase-like metal-dependent hydrolase (beta-lactamase superfamily II) [Aminobacter sp. J44]TWH34879.1 glyoxylase-like metal-dependent hydrolase (beta-lactamase superfamily II) [Aminobacter sp. J15]